jgi:acyl carrier protein
MGLDSVELVMEVEKHFSISIPDHEAEKAYTVGLLVDCVASILRVTGYKFSLRHKTFSIIKSTVKSLNVESSDFLLTDKVSSTLDINNTVFLAMLESKLQLKLPGINTNVDMKNVILSRVNKWFRFIEKIDFETIKWEKYVDITLAFNLDKLNPSIEYGSKYEIYLAIMRITVDKIGVEYSEMGIEKSFADDLGVD